MARRSGYTISSYLLDISPSMSEVIHDPQTGKETSKLELCKEYISRKIAPKIQSGRKTDHAGLITFGGGTTCSSLSIHFITNTPLPPLPRYSLSFSFSAVSFAQAATNNPYHSSTFGDSTHDPNDYIGIASVFPPQTAKAEMLRSLREVEVGDKNGNAITALFVIEELIRQHRLPNKSGNWKKEVVILTDANAKLKQGGWEEVLELIRKQEIVLRIIGVGYDERTTEEMSEKDLKALPKSERFWLTFCSKLASEIPESSPHLLPALGSIFHALDIARGPALDIPNSTLAYARFRIGDKEIDESEAIEFGVRWSKGTAVARPMTLKKVIAGRVEKALPPSVTAAATQGSQSQSQSLGQSGSHTGVSQPTAAMVASSVGIDADVQPYTKYVITRPLVTTIPTQPGGEDVNMEDIGAVQEREVDKENLVKAYKFGSTWVPLNEGDFDDMVSLPGFDVLGFISNDKYRRYQSIGEIYYIWPEPNHVKDQITLSSLVQAMIIKNMFAVVRWAQKETSAPRLGAAVAGVDEDGVDYLTWVQLPFREDERAFLFPSLTQLISKSGKPIEEHKLLPTDDQLLLMDELVDEMDLDVCGEEDEEGNKYMWYDPANSYNPAIHRLKDAVYHQATSADLDADPMPPPHPALLKFLDPPEAIVQRSEATVAKLKEVLDIKVVPPAIKKGENKAAARQGGSNDEMDIDALFAADSGDLTQIKTESTNASGRVISNQTPLEDFVKVLKVDVGDNVAKAMKDLGAVIKENVEGSFSSSAFPLALDCLTEMRRQAMLLEEVELYNEYISDLERFVTAPSFKHKDFWKRVQAARPSLGKISNEEAEEALK